MSVQVVRFTFIFFLLLEHLIVAVFGLVFFVFVLVLFVVIVL